jgi:predicted aspartyl protease
LLDELGKLGDDELVERVRAGKSGVDRLEVRDRPEVDRYLIDRLLDIYNTVAADPEVKAALKELNRGRTAKLAVGPLQAYESRIVAQAAETLRDKALRINKGTANFSLALDDDVIAGAKELDRARARLVELENAEARAVAKLGALVRERKQLAEQAGPAAKAPAQAVKAKTLDAAIAKAKAEDRSPQLAEVAAQRGRYLRRLRDLRKTADEAERRRESVPNDPEVKEALADLDRYRTPKKHRVVVSKTKKLNDLYKHIHDLEGAVESKAVALDADRGMFWVAAAVDDAPKGFRMLVEPDESLVRLSSRTAAALGLRLDDAAEVDVRGLRARRASLATLAVGGCKARDVACLVLPESAGDPPPVLGASFLHHFVADLDPAAGRLTLARVDVGQTTPEPNAKP